MKQNVIIATMALFTFCTYAQNVLPPLKNFKGTDMEKFGGTVKKPTNGKSVLIADMCSEDYIVLSEFIKKTSPALKITFDIKKIQMPTNDLTKSIFKHKDETHPAVIAVIESPDEPSLAIYPEDSIAIVNIASLKTDNILRFKTRVFKELSRAVGFSLGAYSMPRPGCVLEYVQTPKQLDQISVTQLSPFRYINIYRALDKLDIPDSRDIPYFRAVREGWAPSPTNEIQKKIVADWNALKKKRGNTEKKNK